jgi:hemoglobin-like flavoprotein
MAGGGSNFIVRGGADFSGLSKELQSLKGKFGAMRDKINSEMKGIKEPIKKGFDSTKKATREFGKTMRFELGNAFKGIAKLAAAAFAIKGIKDFITTSRSMYSEVVQNETKLATVMRTRMGASNDAIKSLLDYMKQQQQLGVVSANSMAAGAQELATYISDMDALKTIIPVMNNIATQQYGVNVSAQQLASTATMLGKVMDGQLGGLSRWGYTWTESEEAILKNGTAQERAAVIARVVAGSVGDMNYELAKTDVGRQQQLANTMADIKVQFGAAANQIAVLFYLY